MHYAFPQVYSTKYKRTRFVQYPHSHNNPLYRDESELDEDEYLLLRPGERDFCGVRDLRGERERRGLLDLLGDLLGLLDLLRGLLERRLGLRERLRIGERRLGGEGLLLRGDHPLALPLGGDLVLPMGALLGGSLLVGASTLCTTTSCPSICPPSMHLSASSSSSCFSKLTYAPLPWVPLRSVISTLRSQEMSFRTSLTILPCFFHLINRRFTS